MKKDNATQQDESKTDKNKKSEARRADDQRAQTHARNEKEDLPKVKDGNMGVD